MDGYTNRMRLYSLVKEAYWLLLGEVFWVEALREHGVLVTAPFHGSSEYSFLLHWDIAG